MKLIVKEHINTIATPEVKEFKIFLEESGNLNVIPAIAGLAKGDIIVFRGPGDFVRLPVGTRGQVLTADPDTELGVKWA